MSTTMNTHRINLTATTTAILAVIVTAALASTFASADDDRQSGQRRGPPPEALEACADLSEGAACSFSGRRGDVSGICFAPPRDGAELACAPEGHERRPRDRDNDETTDDSDL